MIIDKNPAILGGKPVFPELVQMVRPVLPEFSQLEEGIQQILSSGMVTKGHFVQEFERAVAGHLGAEHAVAVSSCTLGLMLAYKCLGLTGEVIVPSFTFMATVSSLVWCGLRPVFADVNRITNNLDPQAVEAAITPRTSAIVGVHQFGNPADITTLQEVANRHGLILIFDAAHGFGASYQGKPVGKQANAQVFSLSPTKLVTAGEGGIVATNDSDLVKKIRMGREYGNDGNYDSAIAGLNARLPELSALLGLYSLKNLENAARNRNETAALFQEALGRLPGIGFQEVRPGDRHSYRELSITVEPRAFGMTRDELALALHCENVDTRKYYMPPVHLQTAYRDYYDRQPLPNTDWLSTHSLSFPLWSNMSPQVSLGICEAVQCIHENCEAIRQKINTTVQIC